MNLTYLELFRFRNFTHAQADLSPRFNMLYGRNGSGKTSFLEAIYYLGRGKSFRSHLTSRVIQYHADSLAVFGQLQHGQQQIPLGLERHSNGQLQVRLNTEAVTSAATISKLMPLQLIHPESHRLLTDGPKLRRQFLDWGMFHVEPTFLATWQRAQRALKQRNTALRMGQAPAQIQLWNRELVTAADTLDQLRVQYVKRLFPLAHEMIETMLAQPVQLSYYRGWAANRELAEILEQSLVTDQQMGHTQSGPHRADIKASIANAPAHDALSQGQQKLLIYALHLAQGRLISESQHTPIYLLDDLPAELDRQKRLLVIEVLQSLNAQVFITGTERDELKALAPADLPTKMFHVEHALLKPTN